MLKKKGKVRSAVYLQQVKDEASKVHLSGILLLLFSDFHKDPEGEHQHKKKGAKFKPIKVLKRLSHKGEAEKSPRKDKTP